VQGVMSESSHRVLYTLWRGGRDGNEVSLHLAVVPKSSGPSKLLAFCGCFKQEIRVCVETRTVGCTNETTSEYLRARANFISFILFCLVAQLTNRLEAEDKRGTRQQHQRLEVM
jgi:hypothetical protein